MSTGKYEPSFIKRYVNEERNPENTLSIMPPLPPIDEDEEDEEDERKGLDKTVTPCRLHRP